jgi:threonine/homoserine/homoserine lactone efflux protein
LFGRNDRVDAKMDSRRTLRASATGAVLHYLRPHAALAGLTVLAAAPIALIAILVPRPLVLPVLCVAAIAAAAVCALYAWARGVSKRGDTLTVWDVAGACALIGCGAAMLSEPENVLNLLGHGVVP